MYNKKENTNQCRPTNYTINTISNGTIQTILENNYMVHKYSTSCDISSALKISNSSLSICMHISLMKMASG